MIRKPDSGANIGENTRYDGILQEAGAMDFGGVTQANSDALNIPLAGISDQQQQPIPNGGMGRGTGLQPGSSGRFSIPSSSTGARKAEPSNRANMQTNGGGESQNPVRISLSSNSVVSLADLDTPRSDTHVRKPAALSGGVPQQNDGFNAISLTRGVLAGVGRRTVEVGAGQQAQQQGQQQGRRGQSQVPTPQPFVQEGAPRPIPGNMGEPIQAKPNPMPSNITSMGRVAQEVPVEAEAESKPTLPGDELRWDDEAWNSSGETPFESEMRGGLKVPPPQEKDNTKGGLFHASKKSKKVKEPKAPKEPKQPKAPKPPKKNKKSGLGKENVSRVDKEKSSALQNNNADEKQQVKKGSKGLGGSGLSLALMFVVIAITATSVLSVGATGSKSKGSDVSKLTAQLASQKAYIAELEGKLDPSGEDASTEPNSTDIPVDAQTTKIEDDWTTRLAGITPHSVESYAESIQEIKWYGIPIYVPRDTTMIKFNFERDTVMLTGSGVEMTFELLKADDMALALNTNLNKRLQVAMASDFEILQEKTEAERCFTFGKYMSNGEPFKQYFAILRVKDNYYLQVNYAYADSADAVSQKTLESAIIANVIPRFK